MRFNLRHGNMMKRKRESKKVDNPAKKRLIFKKNSIVAVRNDLNSFWLARLKQDFTENLSQVCLYIC